MHVVIDIAIIITKEEIYVTFTIANMNEIEVQFYLYIYLYLYWVIFFQMLGSYYEESTRTIIIFNEICFKAYNNDLTWYFPWLKWKVQFTRIFKWYNIYRVLLNIAVFLFQISICGSLEADIIRFVRLLDTHFNFLNK